MRKVMKAAIALAIMLGNVHPARGALGLAARFGDVILENAEIGRTYNLRETLHLPFAIENRSDIEVEILVEFLIPAKKRLSPEYEAIPDPSWFRAIPERMKIGAKSLGFFDLLLTIPNDQQLKGKHYQAIVKARMAGVGLFALAIENKIRFSIGPGPETLKEEKNQKAMQQLDFDITPQAIYIREVPLGKRYDVKRETRKSIRVANYAPNDLQIQLSSVEWNKRLYSPEGYEPIPDPGWLTFKSSELKIPDESIRQALIYLEIPDEEKYRGKKYSALIKTGLTTGFWLDAPVRVYIETEK